MILDNPESSTKSAEEKSDFLLLGIMQTFLIGQQISYMDGTLMYLGPPWTSVKSQTITCSYSGSGH